MSRISERALRAHVRRKLLREVAQGGDDRYEELRTFGARRGTPDGRGRFLYAGYAYELVRAGDAATIVYVTMPGAERPLVSSSVEGDSYTIETRRRFISERPYLGPESVYEGLAGAAEIYG